ncbi:MAG: N,N-dimethyltransferase [Pirellulaceae bacterium]|nr:MAG: N,N-dimethyltransferase [Pirellulaceae bacterium]
MNQTDLLPGGLYDYPAYYELVFGSDWRAELHFLLAIFERYAEGRVQRLLEPACGTGRLLFRLAQRKFHVTGFDLNPQAVAYCNQRFARHGLRPAAFCADMADFHLSRPVDAAFNMINSFRHLTAARQAADHLRCMAQAVRRGGLYVLGLHLTPTARPPMDEESWSARRGHLLINTRLYTVRRDWKSRQEHFMMECDIYTPTKRHRIREPMVFRMYTLRQFRQLLRQGGLWQEVAVFDFTYDWRHPITPGPDTEDAVFVLKRCDPSSDR